MAKNSSKHELCLKKKSGFTLVELSIVLVIIGFLVGGIIEGGELIQQAKMKAAISELRSLTTSLKTFELKYDCVAGDCANATTFFTGATNGDGNGLIGVFTNGATYGETWNVFTQLASAKLITGAYTGIAGSYGNRHCIPNQNVLKSKSFANTGYTYVNWNGYTDVYSFTSPWVSPKQNVILFGATAWNAYETYAPIMPPAQAYSFDAKIDDGFPGKGKLMLPFPNYWGGNCSTSLVAATATYVSTDDSNVYCSFMYVP